MRTSVLIPTYNSSATIGATLETVLHQTVKPCEILVLDDGSTDNTVSLLTGFKEKVTVLHQKNQGVASARNALFAAACGELLAFLDHDDIWHPRYLEQQCRTAEMYPNAAAYFTGHVDFNGYGSYHWTGEVVVMRDGELISSLNFLKRYNRNPGIFGSMSFCCIPRRILEAIGKQPFCPEASGADDFYLFNLLPLAGPVGYVASPLVAYRKLQDSQSANRLKSVGLAVRALEVLEPRYRNAPEGDLSKVFRRAFASKRRHYGKILLRAGLASEASTQFWYSLKRSGGPACLAKTFAWVIVAILQLSLSFARRRRP